MQPHVERTAVFSLEKPSLSTRETHLSIHALSSYAFGGTRIHALLFSLFRGCLKRGKSLVWALKTRLIRVFLAISTLPLSPYSFSRGPASLTVQETPGSHHRAMKNKKKEGFARDASTIEF
jgi:hypothetical protein